MWCFLQRYLIAQKGCATFKIKPAIFALLMDKK